MTLRSLHFSRRIVTAFILVALAILLVGVTVARASDILVSEFTDGGTTYRLTLEGPDYLSSVEKIYCDGDSKMQVIGSVTTGFLTVGDITIRTVNSNWASHGTIVAESGLCKDDVRGGGANLSCNSVAVAAEFDRYSIQDISFTGNRSTASAGFFVAGMDDMVAVDGLSYDWSTRTWTGTFGASIIPEGEYRGIYLIVFNTDGEQFKCLLGKFVVE